MARRVRTSVGLTAALVLAGASTDLLAQAPVSILSVGVGYNSLKTSVKPTGALKTSIDSLDALITDAGRVGRTGELRRLYAHGTALLRNRAWTPEAEYAASLVLRTERQVIDPARPWSARLEQIFAPSIALQRSPIARVTLRQRQGRELTAPLAVVRTLATLDGVPRDLRDTPQSIEGDFTGLADGTYQVVAEVLDSTRLIGTASLTVVVRAGLDVQVAQLEAAAKTAPEGVRADLLYPVDRLRLVNQGRMELRTFDPARDFAAADSVRAAVKAKRDPWAGRTGDLKRHYLLAEAGEIMPYRLYVPSTYKPGQKMPLIVALHGLGQTEDSFFQAYGGVLPKLAEERGYIVAAPLGYRVDGGYGVALGGNDPGPAAARVRALSEKDVLEVLARMRAQYSIDDDRLFLMGHSMGAIGTWAIAAKTAQQWAALGVFSGFGSPTSAPAIKGLPQFVVHGDADPTVSVAGSRMMVKALQDAGAKVTYIEVPGGDHSNVVAPNLPKMFDLFDGIGRR
jgi:poly(3-hydroxybutyrate) depolymerase